MTAESVRPHLTLQPCSSGSYLHLKTGLLMFGNHAQNLGAAHGSAAGTYMLYLAVVCNDVHTGMLAYTYDAFRRCRRSS